MTGALFAYPEKARRLGKPSLAKSVIYARTSPTRSLRDRFVAEVDQIIWPYWLRPDTVNLPERPQAPIINILQLDLRTSKLDPRILACIDKAVPAPVFFELRYRDRTKVTAAHKRPSEAEKSKWVVGEEYFGTDWVPADTARSPLPVALDLGSLYDQMLRTLMPGTLRPGESVEAHAERAHRISLLTRQCGVLEGKLRREKQFNRKVDLNAEVRTLKTELKLLTD